MLKQAKIKLKSLIYDDSGVAMAYTIMVFLFFFMLCVSTYAMAENIRKKMELQNACDAAAYSGAVVQADMLSRIAVLNRALSWTYYHTGRRHMDYIIDKWLEGILNFHNTDVGLVTAHASTSTCPYGCRGTNHHLGLIHPGGTAYYASSTHGVLKNSSHWTIRFNRDYTRNEISADRSSLSEGPYNGQLRTNIDQGIANIQTLNREIEFLSESINDFVQRAVQHTMRDNMPHGFTVNDFICLVDPDNTNTGNAAASYLRPLVSSGGALNTLEAYFVNYVPGNTVAGIHNGIDTWWTLNNGVNGFQRNYTGTLRASYQVYAERWTYVPPTPYSRDFCIPTYYIDNRAAERNLAMQAVTYRDRYFTSAIANPYALTQSFFGKAGSIIVAAKQPVINPFGALSFDTDKFYGAFNASIGDIWCISASRAGVKLDSDTEDGYYRVLFPGANGNVGGYNGTGVWNLCEENWDAVMLPISRAWNDTNVNSWQAETNNASTRDLFNAVRSALNVNSKFNNFTNNPFFH